VNGAVASPCINVCRMHEGSGWCEGCLRSIDEIARWSVLSDDDKRALRLELDRRRVHWHAWCPPRPAEEA
jgi:uncharacterized protein